MSQERTNIDVANIWIAFIFARLYERFPLPYDFVLSELVETTNERPAVGEPAEFGEHLLNWLRDEGYIRGQDGALGGELLMDFVVLTERGLRVLNAMPPELELKKKIGQKLVEASKDLGRDAVKKGVGDLIGQIVGGIFKSAAM